MMISRYEISTPIDTITYTVQDKKLIGVAFEGHWNRLEKHLQRHGVEGDITDKKKGPFDGQFRRYFKGELTALDDIPIHSFGTRFQQQVWKQLLKIPPGKTASYGQIATRIKNPKAVRAVGLANGCNPVSLRVPCHRVIGADGSLTGFGGGLERKKWLLEHEQTFSGHSLL